MVKADQKAKRHKRRMKRGDTITVTEPSTIKVSRRCTVTVQSKAVDTRASTKQ